MKYAVSPEGVEALKNMSSSATTATDSIVAGAGNVLSAITDYGDTLGPHKRDLLDSLKSIGDSLKQNQSSVAEVSAIINRVADQYQGIIDKSLGVSGNGGVGGGSSSGGGSSGGGGGSSNSSSGQSSSNSGLNEHGVQSIESIKNWVGNINPGFNSNPLRSVNCGQCAAAVHKRLNGDKNAVAGLGTYSISDMNRITGKTQTPMSPEKIKDYIISKGPGSHAVVGVDRAFGKSGHWFNVYYDGNKVYTIDGQDGSVSDWPPNYGNVVNWDIGI